ncbi:MAG: Pyridoxal-dependent decarboxylase [Ferruginibacter sp.]|nr:Pyridoxal-dependent decarboxylase [Ferruginibacter sp.]
MQQNKLLELAKEYAVKYLNDLPGKRAFPGEEALKNLQDLSIPLPRSSKDPGEVLKVLNTIGSDNTVASNGARYFGFVFGGTLPAALAANWLAAAWDQNAVFKISSPISAQLEKVAGSWLLNLLQLPAKSAVGFVTGTTMANFCGVLAARHAIYQRKGWNAKLQGINGAPPIRIIVGEEIHASMLRALMFAGFGSDSLIRVPTDKQGRIIAQKMPPMDDATLVCLQAGNVNTGAIDPVKDICTTARAREQGPWVHVDGAFGLWARVSQAKAALAEGCDLADSWAIDLHKWLNVPYDSGLIICRDPTLLQEALSVSAAYLPDSVEPDPYFYTPEMSRRARGIETWAALYSLGQKGVIELVERCCDYARLFATNLGKAGFQILNDVTLNQVLVSFGDAALTNRIIKKIQEDGTCWCGGTVWQGKTAVRISVSSWMTTADDIEKCSAVIIQIANQEISSKKLNTTA